MPWMDGWMEVEAGEWCRMQRRSAIEEEEDKEDEEEENKEDEDEEDKGAMHREREREAARVG